MTPSIDLIATVIATSITTTSILGILLQELFKRWMSSRFDLALESIRLRNSEQLAALNAELEGQREMLKKVAQVRLEIFPRICEYVYRAKNELSAQIALFSKAQDRSAYRDALGQQVAVHSDALAEACFRNRFLLTEHQFSLLHTYKNYIQGLTSIIAIDEQVGDASWTETSLNSVAEELSTQLPKIVAALQTDEPLFRQRAAT